MYNHDKIKQYVKEYYDIPHNICNIINDSLGSGNNFILETKKQNYFVKFFDLNNPKFRVFDEVFVCDLLNQCYDITSKFLSNIQGKKVTTISNNCAFHVQLLFDGKRWHYNSFPEHLLKESIIWLRKTNTALKNAPLRRNHLFDTINNLEDSCNNFKLLKNIVKAPSFAFDDIYIYIDERLELLKHFPVVDIEAFHHENSHSDYNATQILTTYSKSIYKIIDFSHVSNIPIVWEIVRFYILSDPYCKDGNISFNTLFSLFDLYGALLKPYDYKNALILFLSQILQSTYGFKQYIFSREHKYLDEIKKRNRIINHILTEVKI